MTDLAYIGVGSNLGEKIENCERAIAAIDSLAGCRLCSRSGYYRTEPVGVRGQDWYLNAAVSASVSISARELLQGLLTIETQLGRKRRRKWEPRPVDLDLLVFGGQVIDEADLQVPHPLMHTRRFVLVPLAELDGDLHHPVLGKTVSRLLAELPETGQRVWPLEAA